MIHFLLTVGAATVIICITLGLPVLLFLYGKLLWQLVNDK